MAGLKIETVFGTITISGDEPDATVSVAIFGRLNAAYKHLHTKYVEQTEYRRLWRERAYLWRSRSGYWERRARAWCREAGGNNPRFLPLPGRPK